jgi:hypothetical protein
MVRTKIGQMSDHPTQKSGHFSAIPHRGHPVVLRISGPHDGVVSSSAPLPAGSHRRPESSMRAFLHSDLEWFWPSRRCHAFDEFCL